MTQPKIKTIKRTKPERSKRRRSKKVLSGASTSEILRSILTGKRLDYNHVMEGFLSKRASAFGLNYLLSQHRNLTAIAAHIDNSMKFFKHNPWCFYEFWVSSNIRSSRAGGHYWLPKRSGISKEEKCDIKHLMFILAVNESTARKCLDGLSDEAREEFVGVADYIKAHHLSRTDVYEFLG